MRAAVRRPMSWGVLAGLLTATIGVAALWPAAAGAHGKEVRIDLRCAAADPSTPLSQRCEATVTAANDGDPVSDARLLLRASRPAKGDDVQAEPLRPTGQPGRYAGTLSLPAYGTWVITAEVAAPAEGRVQLTQELLPPTGASSPVAESRASLLIDFNIRDLANLGALAIHLIATIGLFGATGAVLFGGIAARGQYGIEYRRRVARLFPWIAMGSFALIGASGLYNAVYNTPTRSPGLLRLDQIASLPFGEAYVIAFGVKMALAVALLAGTVALAVQLRRSAAWRLAPIAGGAGVAAPSAPWLRTTLIAEVRKDPCVLWAATNLATGILLLLTVLAIDYLHLLSHAGVLAGAA